jgi:hypothetical protein
LAAFAVAAVLLAGCSAEAGPSFDPTGPCTSDGAAEGAYPELEALVPATYEGRGPNRLDSGRNCTDTNLGSLKERGIDEVRFAGGTWDFGSDIAAVLAVFQAENLTAEVMAEWWRTTADDAGRTQITGESKPVIFGAPGFRLDTKTGERVQSVVVWPGTDAGTVNVVLSHNLPDPKIDAGIEAFRAE